MQWDITPPLALPCCGAPSGTAVRYDGAALSSTDKDAGRIKAAKELLLALLQAVCHGRGGLQYSGQDFLLRGMCRILREGVFAAKTKQQRSESHEQ